MAVIGWIAGCDFPVPIEREPHGFELSAHGRDIGVSPCGGMYLVGHGCIFSRHAKRVPSHRVKHIKAFGAAIAGNDIAHRIIAHMAHMDAPGRIGEHLQHIIFGARIIIPRAE